MKKLETKSTVLLKHHLKALKLPTMHDECEKIAARCAKENADHLVFLLQLCEQELIDREKRAADRRLKAAKFPNYKTLEDFAFEAQPTINRVLVSELMRGEYIWDIMKQREVHRLGGHDDAVKAVAFSPDNRTLMTDNRGGIRFYDVDTGELRFELDAHEDTATFLAMPHADKLISCSNDTTAKIWTAATEAEVDQMRQWWQRMREDQP